MESFIPIDDSREIEIEHKYKTSFKQASWFSPNSLFDDLISSTRARLSIPCMIYKILVEELNILKNLQIYSEDLLRLLNFDLCLNEYKDLKKIKFELLSEINEKNSEKLKHFLESNNENEYTGCITINELLIKYYESYLTSHNSSSNSFLFHLMITNLSPDCIYEIPDEIASILNNKQEETQNLPATHEISKLNNIFKQQDSERDLINLGKQNFLESVYQILNIPIPDSAQVLVAYLENGRLTSPTQFIINNKLKEKLYWRTRIFLNTN
jgi:hypothetical protein